ncbi:uncharacterized protein LOC144411824 [Styela clava]
MKVISAGFPKTGTKTMTVALKTLGFNVYDYMENSTILGKDWEIIFKAGGTTEDFRRMYENVDAVSDVPPCYFWQELHKAFPDAKIILTTRDEDSWFKSLVTQMRSVESSWTLKLMSLLTPSGYLSFNILSDHCVGRVIFGLRDSLFWKPFRRVTLNELLLKLKFRKHNSHVIQNAPPKKLLVYNYRQGWEPLCKFLGVPVPDVPFPHKNKGANLVDEYLATDPIMIKIEKELMLSLATILVLCCIGGYCLFSWGPTNIWNFLCSAVEASWNKLV